MFETQFVDFNKLVRIAPGSLIVVGSRPAMGKSSMLRDLGMHYVKKGKSVRYIDTQQNEMEHFLRLLYSEAEVEFDKLPDPPKNDDANIIAYIQQEQERYQEHGPNGGRCALSGMDFQRIVAAANEAQSHNYSVGRYKPTEFEDWIDSAQEFPDVLIVDYMQFFALHEKSPHHTIARLLSKLKDKALDNNSVVFVASNVSREVERMQGHRPLMQHLSESSAFEEIADVVMFILRREHYDPNDKPGTGELIIAKNRGGATGNIRLSYRKEISQFANYLPINYMIAPKEGEYDPFGEFAPV